MGYRLGEVSRLAWLVGALAACGPGSSGGPVSPPAATATASAKAGVRSAEVGVGRHGSAAAHLNSDVPWVASSRDDRMGRDGDNADVTLGSAPPVPHYNIVLPLDDGKTAIAANFEQVLRIDLRSGKKHWQQAIDGYPTLSVSPDGELFALSEDGKGLSLHSTEHGRMVAELTLDKDYREGKVAFSPTGERLAYADYQASEIVVVDVAERQELLRLGGVGAANSLAFSSDGELVAALHYSTLRVWDLARRRTRFIDRQSGWNAMAFAAHGDALWVGGDEGVIERVVPRYDQPRRRFVLPGEHAIYDLVVVPDVKGDVAFVRHAGPYLSLVDLAAGRELARLESTHDAVALSADGDVLVASHGSATSVWAVPPVDQLPAKRPVPWRREPGHLDSVAAVAVTGNRVVTGGDDGTVLLWDRVSGKPLRRRFGHDGAIGAVALAPKTGPMPGAVAFAGVQSGGVWLYDRDLDELLAHLSLGAADEVHIAFDPSGKRLLASRIGDGPDRTEVLDLTTKRVEHTFEGVEWGSFGFTADGRFMLAGPDPAQLVDLERGLRLRKAPYLPHGDYGESTVAILDDTLLVAASVKDDRSHLWLLGSEQRRNERVSLPLAFSAAGGYLATTGEEAALVVLATADGSVAEELPSPPKRRRPNGEMERPWPQVVAFSRERNWLAAGYDDGVARLWRLSLGRVTTRGKMLGVSPPDYLLADLRSAKRAVNAAELDVPVIDQPLRQKRVSRGQELLVSPSGKQLALWSSWSDAHVVDATTGAGIEQFSGQGRDRIRHLSFGRKGDRLAVARHSGTGELRTLTQDSLVTEAKRGCRAAFEAPGDGIACIGSDTQLWRNGKRVGRKLAYAYPDVAVATPDGKLIAYEGHSEIRLVRITHDGLEAVGQLHDHLSPPTDLAFSADGTLLASVGSNVALVHDLSARRGSARPGRLRHILEGHDEVSAVAITADGRRVATAARREAWIWDLSTGKVIARIEASVGLGQALAFLADGTLVALGGRNTLTWWKVP